MINAMMDKNFELIRKYLNGYKEVLLCIVYGSAVNGNIRVGSDYDIAVAGDNPFSYEKLSRMQIELSELLGREVDLLDLSYAQGFILKQVISKGFILIKRSTSLYASIIKKMWYFEADMAFNYRMILKTRVKRFINGL